MGIYIKNPVGSFLALVTIFFAYFAFIAGIGLAATNNLAVGLSLVLADILTIVTAILLLYTFEVVVFPNPVTTTTPQNNTV